MQSAPLPVVHVGYACTNRCVFCAQGEQRSRELHPLSSQVLAELQRLAETGSRSVAFVGGEPTLHSELPNWIGQARTAGFDQIVVQTNGRRLAYSAYARELAALGVTGVEISMAGPRADIHDYHTRVPGSFRQTMRGILSARSAGLRVSSVLVITRSNFRHLTEHVALAGQQGVHALLLSVAARRGSARADFGRVVPRAEAVAHEVRPAAELGGQLGLSLFAQRLPPCLIPQLSPTPLELLGPSFMELPHGHGPPCQQCTWLGWCPGLEAAYAAHYGFDELEPVTENDSAAIDRARERAAPWAASFAGLGPTEPLEPEAAAPERG